MARAADYSRAGGPWDVPTLDALGRVGADGRGLSVVDGPVRLDASALAAAVAAVAGSLREQGVGRHDVVAWQLPNGHQAVVLYRACWRLGAVAAPLHHQVGLDEVADAIARLDPVLTFAGPGMPVAEVTATIDVVGSELATRRDAAPVLEGVAEPADVAVVLFTSGSSGRPKGVRHTHRGLASKAVQMEGLHGLGPGDVSLMPLPMAHVSGLLNGLLVPMAAGMTTVLMDRWDPVRGLELVETERVTFMVGPPPLFDGLIDVAGADTVRLSSIRVVSTGAMGVSTEFVARAAGVLGAQVKRTYGSTEAPTITTCAAFDGVHDDELAARGRDTDGRPSGDTEIRTVDPATGDDVDPGEVGEVWCRGPELFDGYLDAEQTQAAFRDGWFRTGDLGVLDDEGWLRIVGRLKDVIIRGGENISPAEVERVLEEHPDVTRAVVVGRPDPRLGERVAAFVVAADTFDLDACRDWFRGRGVAVFKTPELIARLDAIPVLPAGKPDLAALRAAALDLPDPVGAPRGGPR